MSPLSEIVPVKLSVKCDTCYFHQPTETPDINILSQDVNHDGDVSTIEFETRHSGEDEFCCTFTLAKFKSENDHVRNPLERVFGVADTELPDIESKYLLSWACTFLILASIDLSRVIFEPKNQVL